MTLPVSVAHILVGLIEAILVVVAVVAGAVVALTLGFNEHSGQPFVALPFAASMAAVFRFHRYFVYWLAT